MEANISELRRIYESLLEMLHGTRATIPVEGARGEAVLAGRNRDGKRVGVLVEDEMCLVILSRNLAIRYGLRPPLHHPTPLVPPPEPTDGADEAEPTVMYRAMSVTGGGRTGDGLCVWDPVTGQIHCMDAY